MEMERQDGTEFVFSYTFDVNENRQEGCKIPALQTLGSPSQTLCVHVAKSNCTEMLDSGPKRTVVPVGSRVTPEEMVANGFPETDPELGLCMGPIGGVGASLVGCSAPTEGEAGFMEFQTCLTSRSTSAHVNTRTARSDGEEPARMGNTTSASQEQTPFAAAAAAAAAPFGTCVNGFDGLGGKREVIAPNGTDATTRSNRATFGQTGGTGTSGDSSNVAREFVIGGTKAGQSTPGETAETRSNHASLVAAAETRRTKRTGTSSGLALEAPNTGNVSAGPVPLDQVPGLSQLGTDTMKPDSRIQDAQERPELCARNNNVSCTETEAKISNGNVTRGTTGEQGGRLRCSAALDKGVRVGNCGLLVISKRPLCEAGRPGGEIYDANRERAFSEGCEERVDLGAARPRSLRTKPGHTGSLSCDATPLDEDCFMAEADVDEVLDSVSGLDLSRRQSAPDKLQERDDPEEPKVAKGLGITDFLARNLFSWKPREPKATPNASGWRIFGKLSPKENGNKDSTILQQESKKAAQPTRRRNLEFEPLSTTGLILEDRPANLPAKSEQEAQRHRQEYNEMVAGARRRELKEAQRKKRQMKERYRQEESIARALVTWNNEILPNWETMRNTWRVRELWWHGLPPSIRGKIWSLAIGNELNITPELYEIFLSRAKEKWRRFNETSSLSESEDCGADKESSLDLIKLDIFRTFPSLYIFQKGGPYHDVLHSVLGAYTCYRPDVGYVQGMSFIAAVLILNLEEADAFIAFANLLNKPCQMAFFRVDHDLMLKYFAAFEVFFEENLPKLFQHFQSNSLTPDFYLIDWIFTLYSKPLPLDVACRVWDLFCRDGEEALFRTALGILRLHQDVLLQMDFIHIAQFLSRLPQDTPTESLFGCIANTHMLSNNRRWNQVFSALIKDGPKDADKTGSPALRS